MSPFVIERIMNYYLIYRGSFAIGIHNIYQFATFYVKTAFESWWIISLFEVNSDNIVQITKRKSCSCVFKS